MSSLKGKQRQRTHSHVKVTTQGLSFKGKGEETSTHQFPEGTPLAKTSKVTLQDSFPTSLEISWPWSDGGFTWSSVDERVSLFYENTILQDALHTPGVTSCPPLTAKGPGLPEIHLQAHPVEVSGLQQSQMVHHQ